MSEHQKMQAVIEDFVKRHEGYALRKPTSMPTGSNRNTRIYIPDVLATRDGNITHIIEPETETGATTIIGKIVLANRCMEILFQEGKQESAVKPKLVFIHGNTDKLRRAKIIVERTTIVTPHLKEVILEEYGKWDWW